MMFDYFQEDTRGVYEDAYTVYDYSCSCCGAGFGKGYGVSISEETFCNDCIRENKHKGFYLNACGISQEEFQSLTITPL